MAAAVFQRPAPDDQFSPGAPLHTHTPPTQISETGLSSPAAVRDMHALLRSAMLRLQHTTTALAPLPADATWRLQARIMGPVPECSWIEAEAPQPQPTPALIPVRSVKLPGSLALQLYVRMAPIVAP